jgi:hypothetical protein
MKAKLRPGPEDGPEREALQAFLRQWDVGGPPPDLEEDLRRAFRRRRSGRRPVVWLAAGRALPGRVGAAPGPRWAVRSSGLSASGTSSFAGVRSDRGPPRSASRSRTPDSRAPGPRAVPGGAGGHRRAQPGRAARAARPGVADRAGGSTGDERATRRGAAGGRAGGADPADGTDRCAHLSSDVGGGGGRVALRPSVRTRQWEVTE